MSNIQTGYCPCCGRNTEFYHVDPEFWECEECGYAKDDPEDDDGDYYDGEGMDDTF